MQSAGGEALFLIDGRKTHGDVSWQAPCFDNWYLAALMECNGAHNNGSV